MRIEMLSKSFGTSVILNSISFRIERGECIYLSGANGSGKSTCIKLLAGLIKPTHGMINNDWVRSIAFLLENMHMSEGLTINTNLKISIRYSHSNKVPSFSIPFNIQPYRNKTYQKCSAGMKKKALLNSLFGTDSDLFLLDEPFDYLDEDSIDALKKEITIRRDSGTSFLITSHNPYPVYDLLSKWIRLSQGGIIEVKNPNTLSLEEFIVGYK